MHLMEMPRAATLTAMAILVAGSSAAQVSSTAALPAYWVGNAHAMLMSAKPCFAPADEANLMDLLQLSLARVFATPDDRESYNRGMMDTQRQQRYIRRSDPIACNEVLSVLRYFVALHERQ